MKISFTRQKRNSGSFFSIADGRAVAKNKIGAIGLLSAALLMSAMGLGACAMKGQSRESVKKTMTDTAMGTIVRLTVYVREEGDDTPGDEILEMVRSLEEDFLSWRMEGSEVSRINSAAQAGQVTELSGEMEALLGQCMSLSEDSEGAFDVTLGALTRLWRMDELAGGQTRAGIPGEDSILKARRSCGYEKLSLAAGKLCMEEGALLDLGAVGKGYALDRIRKLLEEGEHGITGGVFSLGGSILIYGEKPDGSPWKVAVADPLQPDSTIGYLELPGQWCVSTSGDYERYFEKDGVTYHHILDPATGYPARSGLKGVTILSESGFLSDALSTACFVLGREKGMELAQRYGVGILVVDEEGSIFYNREMEAYFHRT